MSNKFTQRPGAISHQWQQRLKTAASLALLGLLLGLPVTGIAGNDTILKFQGGDLSYSGPADDLTVGQQIGPAWVASGSNDVMCGVASERIFSTAYIRPLMPPTPLTVSIDGVTYNVFETGTPGIGWIMGVKDKNANSFTPLLPGPTIFYPVPGTASDARVSIGGQAKITLVKTSTRLVTGETLLPGTNLAQIQCMDRTGAVRDDANIRMEPKKILVEATGCEVISSKAPVVNMGKFKTTDFPSVGSTAGDENIQISLKCNNNIILAATISDLSDVSNFTDTLSLTQDSGAKGLGVYVYNGSQSTPQQLGPDSSAKGTFNQFYIKTTSVNGENVELPLRFKYVRTGDMTPGSANALVGVTFSYQ